MIDFENANEIFDVYGVYPNEAGKVESYMIGRFLIEKGNVKILEDHNGILHGSLHNGPVERNLHSLEALSRSSYLRVVSEAAVSQGHHIDLVPKGVTANPIGPQPEGAPDFVEQSDVGEGAESLTPTGNFSMQTPPAVFDYFRVGMREPQVLEVRGNEVFMNGQKLEQGEVDHILEGVHNGLAKLKYRKAV